ncbi:enoyl-CoA hydratase-related protein [Aminobacter sp. MDW-2]|uniref:enoyl-CoA hydratase-related protein n=1 Tax=Aminobacter sp. MDW-2 TaxID=2666139 RepID=UPI0012AF54D5|nr:enoyl-CoA hydratase-related protein [Aminobacter sp. MDW-2]MRX31787.1 enoyl-CoA hydratase [Aminobacter sp. MDW-2]QNH32265.1 enoyl-CoA hydratase/isomerase family protein [Aminobacter sp. MDW-2]WMC94755.1 enoyl-CoA hydratase-related protein [Aminobacter aminovorans]
METEPLLVMTAGGVATIVINRPSRKNAVTQAMWVDLARHVLLLSSNPDIRVIVLSGAGQDFSAGADISEFDTLRGDADSARAYEATNSAAFAALRNSAIPVIAAIRGICFGGGFGLAAACDLRIATPDALFAVPAARLGLAYPQDAMGDIVWAAGPQMARYLIYTAGRIDAQAALSAGFLLETVEPERFDARVAEISRTIAENAPLSVRASKAAIRAVLSRDAGDTALARAAGDATFLSDDYAEGRAAFAGRRTPVFKGR